MIRALVGLIAAGALCGCSSATSSNDESSQVSSTSISATTDRVDSATFDDPCAWVTDEMVRSFGFDPTTRTRDSIESTQSVRSSHLCQFSSSEGQLLLISSGDAYDQNLTKYRDQIQQHVAINGRDAVVVLDSVEPDTCDVVMRSTEGTVFVSRTVFANTTSPCDGLVDVATEIEPRIGREK